MKARSRGFTILELLISLAVIAVLGSIAVPSYKNYLRRAYFNELVQAAEPYKEAIDLCIKKTKTTKGCDAGKNKIPAAIAVETGPVASLIVANGIIKVTPVPKYGIKETDTLIMTPIVNDGTVTWANSGGGVLAGYLRTTEG